MIHDTWYMIHDTWYMMTIYILLNINTNNLFVDSDARSMTPSRNTRSCTLRSVPSSPGRSFLLNVWLFFAFLFPWDLWMPSGSHIFAIAFHLGWGEKSTTCALGRHHLFQPSAQPMGGLGNRPITRLGFRANLLLHLIITTCLISSIWCLTAVSSIWAWKSVPMHVSFHSLQGFCTPHICFGMWIPW